MISTAAFCEKRSLYDSNDFSMVVLAPDVACSFCRDFTSICGCQQIGPPYFIPTSLSLPQEVVLHDPMEATKAGP